MKRFLDADVSLWALAFSILLLLTACSGREEPGFTVEGEIPMEGKIVVRR